MEYQGADRRSHHDLGDELCQMRKDFAKALTVIQQLQQTEHTRAKITTVVWTVITVFGSGVLTLAWQDRKENLGRLEQSVSALTVVTAELTRLKVDYAYLQSQVDKLRDKATENRGRLEGLSVVK